MAIDTASGEATPGVAAHRGAPARTSAGRSRTRALAPYAALLPTLLTFVVLLGYPVVMVVLLSFQKYNLAELFGRAPTWIGLDNYREILGNPTFLTVVVRTFGFTLVNVALTILVGTLIGLLLPASGGRSGYCSRSHSSSPGPSRW